MNLQRSHHSAASLCEADYHILATWSPDAPKSRSKSVQPHSALWSGGENLDQHHGLKWEIVKFGRVVLQYFFANRIVVATERLSEVLLRARVK